MIIEKQDYVDPHDHEEVVRLAGIKVAKAIGELGFDCEEYETENIEWKTIGEKYQEFPDLPKVVFHSLRHSSITYKLKLNGGDIKAVQGDSGHAQATMVTEQYSHVLTDGQQANAELIEKYFYGKEPIPERQGTENTSSAGNSGESMELLTKLLANPETAALLKALAEKL